MVFQVINIVKLFKVINYKAFKYICVLDKTIPDGHIGPTLPNIIWFCEPNPPIAI